MPTNKVVQESKSSFFETTMLVPEKDVNHALNTSTVLSEDDTKVAPSNIFSAILSKFQGGTVGQGTLTLIAATIGTGTLMVSNSLAPSGIIWGSLQQVFCAWLCYYTLITLCECCDDMNVDTYQEIAVGVFGDWFRHVFNFCCFCCSWGSVIIYMQITVELFATICNFYGGSALPTWLTDPESQILTVLHATLFVLPLSVPKEFKSLNYFCFVNLILIVLFCYAIFYEGFDYEPISFSWSSVTMFTLSGVSTTLPSAMYNMTPHLNLLMVFRELKSQTISNIRIVIVWTIGFALVIFIVVGVFGYIPFAPNIDILSDSQYGNGVVTVAYGFNILGNTKPYTFIVMLSMITMVPSILISQPFNVRPAKDAMRSSCRTIFKKFGWIDSDDESDYETYISHFLYTFFIVYTSVLVVLFSDNIQTIMNILGSSFVALVCFVFPSMFYLKLRKDTMTLSEKVINWAIAVGTTIFAAWATIENILQSI